jgi:hypothetical protein
MRFFPKKYLHPNNTALRWVILGCGNRTACYKTVHVTERYQNVTKRYRYVVHKKVFPLQDGTPGNGTHYIMVFGIVQEKYRS